MTQPLGQAPVLREEWLMMAVEYLRREFAQKPAVTLPYVRLSVGFPVGVRGPSAPKPGTTAATASVNKRAQCWPPSSTEDGMAQIFVNPTISDSREILVSLVHEMAHVVSGDPSHERVGPFNAVIKSFGLLGSYGNPKVEQWLEDIFTQILLAIGPYEDVHAKVILSSTSGGKKQGTFMQKVFCRCCGDLSRRTQTHINKLKEAIAMGAPSCAKCFVGHPDCTGLCKQQQPPQPPQPPGGTPPKDMDITPDPNQQPQYQGAKARGEGEADAEEETDGAGGDGAGGGPGDMGATLRQGVVMSKSGQFKPVVHRKDMCPFGSSCPQCEGDY